MQLIRSLGGLATLTLLSAAAAPVAAQPRGGSVELGVHARHASFDDDLALENGFGLGGRLGVFLYRRVAIEGEVDRVTVDRALPGGGVDDASYTPIYARLTYNLPVGRRAAVLFGAGYARQDFDFATRDAGSALLGARLNLTPSLALRAEALADYTPSAEQWNYGARAGLSVILRPERVSRPEPRLEPTPPTITPEPPPPQVDADAERRAREAAEAAERERVAAALRATLQEPVYFDFDQSALRPEAVQALERKLAILRANPSLQLRIAGYADPRGSDEYNLALGERRADASRRYLVDQGIDASRLTTVSLGEEELVCTEETEACYQRNRRDEFSIVAGGEMLVAPGR